MTDPLAPAPSPAPNPYAAPAADISGGPVTAAADITDDEVAAYVGNRHFYYWRHWRRAMAAGRFFAGFNVPAAFFNLYWMVYRKMYREFGLVLALSAGLSIGIGLALAATGDVGISESAMERIVQLGVALGVGAFGNGLYLRRARLEIARARRDEVDPTRRMALLQKRGGTSTLWTLVALAASVVITALLAGTQ